METWNAENADFAADRHGYYSAFIRDIFLRHPRAFAFPRLQSFPKKNGLTILISIGLSYIYCHYERLTLSSFNRDTMNKFLLSVVFMAFLCTVSRAQNPTWQANEPILPKAYIGIGGGLENISGLIGVTGDLRVQKNFFLRAGAGLGS